MFFFPSFFFHSRNQTEKLTPMMLDSQSNHMRRVVPSVITKIKARQILDSRGIPTVEVDLHTNKGMFRASVPSGDVTGM